MINPIIFPSDNSSQEGKAPLKHIEQIVTDQAAKIDKTDEDKSSQIGSVQLYSEKTEAEQIEQQKVVQLFHEKIKRVGDKSKFKRHGYLKLSRRETGLQHTFYVQKTDLKDVNSLEMRLIRVVHGKEGSIGDGANKIAKHWVAVDGGKNLVNGRFISMEPAEIAREFAQMKAVLEFLKNNPVPYTAPGHYIEVSSNAPKHDNKTRVSIVTEFAESDLDKQIRSKVLEPQMKLNLALNIIDGASALHNVGVFHRDLKPANILIQNGEALITDFDYAVMKPDSRLKGTWGYMSPECFLNGGSRNVKELIQNDTYAIGVSLYELFYGIHPADDGVIPDVRSESVKFMELNEGSYLAEWEKKRGPLNLNTIDEVIFMLMHPDPQARLTLAGAKEQLSRTGS